MSRPRKPEDEKLVGVSATIKAPIAEKIQAIVNIESSDFSKVVRKLIEEALESRDQMMKRGSALAPRLIERLKQLSLTRQYDLLAIADAMIAREQFERTQESTPPEAQTGFVSNHLGTIIPQPGSAAQLLGQIQPKPKATTGEPRHDTEGSYSPEKRAGAKHSTGSHT